MFRIKSHNITSVITSIAQWHYDAKRCHIENTQKTITTNKKPFLEE